MHTCESTHFCRLCLRRKASAVMCACTTHLLQCYAMHSMHERSLCKMSAISSRAANAQKLCKRIVQRKHVEESFASNVQTETESA